MITVDATASSVTITSGGIQVTLNRSGGGSILFPGGIGIAVDATGRISLKTGSGRNMLAVSRWETWYGYDPG